MRCRMVRFDLKSGNFYATDLGRTASHYYIHHESIETYNAMITPIMKDCDILNLIAHSREFEQVFVCVSVMCECDV